MKWILQSFTLAFLAIGLIPLNGLAQTEFAPEWMPEDAGIVSGMLEVPEDHDDPEGPKIQIAYMVIPAAEPEVKDPPMIFFSGGPGGKTLNPGMVNFLLQQPFSPTRPIILFDQRGIGYSSPLPDMSFSSFNILAKDASPEQELVLTREMIENYKDSCSTLGKRPQFYNSLQNARDVGRLFKHLGYEKYVLYGGSYGTRIARVVQDMFPEFVHCSLLDSPAPMQGDFLLNRFESYTLALGRIFDNCKTDSTCNSEFPNLASDYLQALKELDKNPFEVSLGDSIPFVVNAQDGIYLIRRLLYQNNARKRAPELIRAFLERNPEPVHEVLEFEYMLTGGLNLTMLLSVERFEQFNPVHTAEVIKARYKNYPLLPYPLGFFDAFYQAGMDWHPSLLPLEERKFQFSEVPSLIFVNRYDPVTPPENGALFMKHLGKGTLLVLDEDGHGSGNPQCKQQVMEAFMQNPLAPLDTSCLNLYQEKE